MVISIGGVAMVYHLCPWYIWLARVTTIGFWLLYEADSVTLLR
jgi:hypothetical protein